MKRMFQALLVVGFISATLISGVFSNTAHADMSEACNKYTDSRAKSACENGYNGAQCNTFSGASLPACEAGKAQATTDGIQPGNNNGTNNGSTGGKSNCGGAKTEIVSCDEGAGIGAIASIIRTVTMIVTILIGVIATGGITYAAILYASARDNKGQVEQAMSIIRNVVIGLVLYGFTVALINWLIPGVVIG